MTEFAESRRSEEERRRSFRYPINLALRFFITSGAAEISRTGEGESVNISRTGLLFESRALLKSGERLVAALDWPVVGSEGKPMTLMIWGDVVWRRGTSVGMAISRHGIVLSSIAAPRSAQQPIDASSGYTV